MHDIDTTTPAVKAPKRHLFLKGIVLATVFGAGALVGSTGGTDTTTTPTASEDRSTLGPVAKALAPQPTVTVTVQAKAPAATKAPAKAPAAPAKVETKAPPAKVEAGPTSGQANAMASGESYLEMSGFSRKGLIDQLKFEKFSTADATYAVDHLNADWNVQAERSAKEYLDTTSFSLGGLIDQLEFEGYTHAQASHGASVALR